MSSLLCIQCTEIVKFLTFVGQTTNMVTRRCSIGFHLCRQQQSTTYNSNNGRQWRSLCDQQIL